MSVVDETGRVRPGALDADLVRVIDAPSLRAFIALAPEERADRFSDLRLRAADVRLDAPVRPERNVFCVGRNYLEHALEGARAFGREFKLPDVPTFFTKSSTAIAAPNETLRFESRISREYDFEAELAVVIGTRCKDVEASSWRDAVFGYTCLNDLTARDLQRAHGQWFKGKSLDHACPIGPWIVSVDEIGDPQSLEISLRRNGIEKQHANTSEMIFSIPRLIAELSRGMTLLPGDIIATGTPQGVGFARVPPEFLANGDLLEVEIDGIGILRNQVEIA